jgi:hypothetical protein
MAGNAGLSRTMALLPRPNKKGFLGATQKAFFKNVHFRGRIFSKKQDSCQLVLLVEKYFLVKYFMILQRPCASRCYEERPQDRTEFFTPSGMGAKGGQEFVPGKARTTWSRKPRETHGRQRRFSGLRQR